MYDKFELQNKIQLLPRRNNGSINILLITLSNFIHNRINKKCCNYIKIIKFYCLKIKTTI
jgi:hypothetical protein